MAGIEERKRNMGGRNGSSREPWMLERRAFLKMGFGLGGLLLFEWADPIKAALAAQQDNGPRVTPRASARNALFIVLRGGPSHIDTFDIKPGAWTPSTLGVAKTKAGFLWPFGVMPRLAERIDSFTLVRSLQHQEVVHERAQYYLETGRRLNPGLRSEIPHIGAVVALEAAQRRSANDIFPGSIMLNFGAYSGNGFLPIEYAPFSAPNTGTGIKDLLPPDGLAAFDRRHASLQLLNEINSGQTDSGRQPLSIFQDMSEKMMRDPITLPTFSVKEEDRKRYGENYFGVSLAMARNILKADRGTRFIEIDQYGWDHHNDIYKERPDGLFQLCRELDQGLSALLDDLASSPGTATGKSLLDETLVVVMGEFGRTVGPLNSSNGRDHYPYVFPGLFAGGGVKGGRIIGSSDDAGNAVLDMGWSQNRPIHLPDLVATIYSVLGIDWTRSLSDTPSGRIFRYTDPEAVGDQENYEITPLF
jgi:hypothetical protein